jgi:hypothetical protein
MVMRGIRIAAFVLAAVLACVVISHMFSIEPASIKPAGIDSAVGPPQVEHSADLGMAGPANVPPPPPLPGSQPAQPRRPGEMVKERTAPEKAPRPQNPARIAQNADADQPAPDAAGAKAVIWRGNDPSANNDDGSAAAVAQTVPLEQPQPPVIVVPHERPKEESRGMHWLKAVGHALGIGGPKDPVQQAFQ